MQGKNNNFEKRNVLLKMLIYSTIFFEIICLFKKIVTIHYFLVEIFYFLEIIFFLIL